MSSQPRTARVACALALAAGIALPGVSHANSAPVVTNVVAQQIAGTGQVRVTYDVSDADGDLVTAVLVCSSNNGVAFDMLPTTVSGDVNRTMTPGPGKAITWNAAADYPGRFFGQMVAKVIAADGLAVSTEMVVVPAGAFTMGTVFAGELPIRSVYLDAFSIDKYEVTNAAYKQFIDSGGYASQPFWSAAGWAWKNANAVTQPLYWGDDTQRSGVNWPGFPVIGVSYYEAEAYATFVGKRLPTEAEWEKAARGTDARTYPWGEGLSGANANYSGSGDPYSEGLTPIGFYDGRLHPSPLFQTVNSPSPYGAYDMAGNAWEWVKDWYAGYDAGQTTNPQGPATGTSRVLRGGAWGYDTSTLRCAARGNNDPTGRGISVGFRCARTGL